MSILYKRKDGIELKDVSVKTIILAMEEQKKFTTSSVALGTLLLCVPHTYGLFESEEWSNFLDPCERESFVKSGIGMMCGMVIYSEITLKEDLRKLDNVSFYYPFTPFTEH